MAARPTRQVSCFLCIGTILWNKELNCRKAQGQKTSHPDAAATAHTAERWQQYWENLQLVHI